MAVVAAVAAVASAAVAAYGSYQAAENQKAAGKAAEAAGQYQAQIANVEALSQEQAAGQQRAAAQRSILEERRRAGTIESRSRTIAAAQGGALESPDYVNLLGDIGREGDYRAAVARYEGDDRGQNLEYQALLTRAGGAGAAWSGQTENSLRRAAANRAYTQVAGSLLSAVKPASELYSGLGGGFKDSNYLYDPLKKPGYYQ